MKIQKMKVKFKVFREHADVTMNTIENFCNSNNITYTYSVKGRFFPMKSVVDAEFEGQDEDVNKVYKYIQDAHGAKLIY